MFPMLRVALRIQDMLILLIIGCLLLGAVYLIEQLGKELRKGSVAKTNFTPGHAPQFYFLLMALMAVITGIFTPANEMLDWQLYDTYFVISLSIIAVAAAGYFLFVSLVYFLARRLSLVKWMAVLHLALTAIIGLVFYRYYLEPAEPEVDLVGAVYKIEWARGVVFSLLAPVFSIVQILLPLNILIGLWRRR
ncbi:MAG: hypothetical protein AB8H12_14165 [Lewinella sp.]